MERFHPLLSVAVSALSLLFAYTPALAQQPPSPLPGLHDARAFRASNAEASAKQSSAAPRLLAYTWSAAQNSLLKPIDSFQLSYVSKSSAQVKMLAQYRFQDDAWHPFDRFIYFYDPAGNSLRTDYELFDKNGDTFQHLVRYNYTIDTSTGAITDLLYQIWDRPEQQYVNGYAEHYEHNGRNQILSLLQRFWDKSDQDWDDYMLLTNTYTSAGQMTGQTQQFWNAGLSLWENRKRFSWDFPAATGHAQADTSFTWDNMNHTWIEKERNRYVLNASGKPTASSKESFTSAKIGWEPVSQSSYKYDATGRLIGEILQPWDSASHGFVNLQNKLSSYNKFDQPVVESTLIWDGMGWGIGDNADRTMYYYEGALNTPEVLAGPAPLTVWPLPAGSVLHIAATSGDIDLDHAAILLTDVQGRRANTPVLSAQKNTLTLSVEALPAGIYWMWLRDAQGREASLKIPVFR
jgi:hypothetical protein